MKTKGAQCEYRSCVVISKIKRFVKRVVRVVNASAAFFVMHNGWCIESATDTTRADLADVATVQDSPGGKGRVNEQRD